MDICADGESQLWDGFAGRCDWVTSRKLGNSEDVMHVGNSSVRKSEMNLIPVTSF